MMNKAEHRFGPAPAGTGRLRVCMVCGAREISDTHNNTHPASACSGRPVVDPACEVDYDPIP